MDVPMDWLRQVGVGSRLTPEQKKVLSVRIKQARLERGWTQARLGEVSGVTSQTISSWERTAKSFQGPLGILGLAYLLEKPPAWFLGKELSVPDDPDASVRSRMDILVGLLFAGAAVRRVSLDVLFGLSDGEADPEFPALDEYWAGDGLDQTVGFPVAAAAGAGAEVSEEILVDYVQLDPPWLRGYALNPDRCDLISVTGDSMFPTLRDGCAILVDRSSVELRDGGIFVLRTPDGLVVKRVRRDDGEDRWILTSDNPAWSTAPLDADVSVVGQVRWAGGMI